MIFRFIYYFMSHNDSKIGRVYYYYHPIIKKKCLRLTEMNAFSKVNRLQTSKLLNKDYLAARCPHRDHYTVLSMLCHLD